MKWLYSRPVARYVLSNDVFEAYRSKAFIPPSTNVIITYLFYRKLIRDLTDQQWLRAYFDILIISYCMGKKGKNKNQNKQVELEKKESEITQQADIISKEKSVTSQESKQQLPAAQVASKKKAKHQPQDKPNKNEHQKVHKNHKPLTHREQKGENEKFPHFAWQEVGRHDHKDDLWVVIEGGVYNLTKFVDKHPGGPRVIALRAGRKADEAFIAGNHPPRVMQKTLLQYRIGSVKQDSMIESWQREHKTGRMDSFMAIMLTVLIVGFMGYMIV